MSNYTVILIFILVAWSIYRRIRRTVGYQPLLKGRLLFRIGLFVIVGLLIVAEGFRNPILWVADAVGLLLGIGVAIIAMRTTTFEKRDTGWFYKPHPWIGFGLLVLFLGRLLFRFVALYGAYSANSGAMGSHAGPAHYTPQSYAGDPWTVAVLFLLIGYYLCYYLFLIRRERHLEQVL